MVENAISSFPVMQAIDRATATAWWSTELDARSSSPPDNFRAIFDALNLLSPGHPQFVRTQSCPAELLEKFAARGVSTATEKLPDGSWRSVLCWIGPKPRT